MSNFSQIIGKSPDPNIVLDSDLNTAKLGDVNYIIRAIQNAPTYTSNAAALAGGLQAGELYFFQINGAAPKLLAMVS